jgi:inhibitor of cysteine peptidase
MPDILITQDDQGRKFEANQGDRIVIRLAENPSTGYEWELEAIDSPVVELLDSDYSPDPGVLMGRGGTRTLRFRAKSSGSQQIQLRLRRSWDPEDVAVEHFDVNIRVQ